MRPTVVAGLLPKSGFVTFDVRSEDWSPHKRGAWTNVRTLWDLCPETLAELMEYNVIRCIISP